MNKLLSILAVLLVCASASAQFVQGPAKQAALVVSTVFRVPANTTTNIPASLAPAITPGRDGIAVSVLSAGTNSIATTNCILVFKPIVDGLVAGPTTYSVSFTVGATAGLPYQTNLASSLPSLLNVPALRLFSIQNTNDSTLFVTNVYGWTR